jgi:hypothetical protein
VYIIALTHCEFNCKGTAVSFNINIITSQVEIQLPDLQSGRFKNPYSWMITVNHKCCVQLFHIVQMQTVESKTVGKKPSKTKKNGNWLWAEQVSLTASKGRNFSFFSRSPNQL